MKRFPQLTVFLAWLLATLVTFAAGVGATVAVAGLTHSGLGSCGPYGPGLRVMEYMLIGSFPVSIVAGFWVAWRASEYLKREREKI
jgi:hypothetical protein